MQRRPKRLLDQVRDAIRLKHYAASTEKTYVNWIKRYILFHGKRHPREMGGVESRLSSLTSLWISKSPHRPRTRH